MGQYSRTGTENIQDEPRASCSSRKSGSTQNNNYDQNLQWGVRPRDMGANCKNTPGPKLEPYAWQNKVLSDYNPTYRINIESVQI